MRLIPLLTILLLALADDTLAKTRRVKRGSCKTPQQPLMASSSNGKSSLGSTGQQKPGAGLQSLGSINLGGSSGANQAAQGSGGSGSGISGGSTSSQGPGGQSNGGSAGSVSKAPGLWRNSTGSTPSGQQISGGSSGAGQNGDGSNGGASNSNANGGSAGTSGGSSGAAAAGGGGGVGGAGSATTEASSANTTATAIGAVMSSSFTQYGAGDSFGSPSCNTATAACGWYSNPGFNAAVSENLFGVGPGGGAGETCGKCYRLTATSDQNGKPLSGGGGNIVVKVNNLCPKAGNPLCSQEGMGGTNQYGANVNFDICKDDGAAAHFFGGSSGMALGTAEEVDCGAWSGGANLSS